MTIKVCGLRTADEIQDTLEAGADLVGLVHHEPSPRHLTWDAIGTLLASTGCGERAVVVTVDPDPAHLAERCRELGIGAVQLCGDEDPAAFQEFPARVLRRVGVDERGAAELEAWSGIASAFVLDHPSAAGGTGRAVDPALARDLCARARCLLAGGLAPDSVAGAVRAAGAAGADASSGLERAPGQKDMELVRAFVDAARGALVGMEADA